MTVSPSTEQTIERSGVKRDMIAQHRKPRGAEALCLDEWRKNYNPYSALVYIAVKRPSTRRRKVRLSRLEDGTWAVTSDPVEGHCFQLNLDLLAAQVWAAE